MSETKYTKVFWMTYDAAAEKPRYISERGGTRSGKTYAILQFLNELIPSADRPGDITSVVSETLPHLKKGAIRDFENIRGMSLKDDPAWNASDNIYTYPNGAKLEFFSVDAPQRVQGPARKRLFANEGNHIRYDTFRQLAVRTTGLIIIDYNPEESCWIDQIIEQRQNCICIHSTYLNNDCLTKEQIDEIEANRDTDPNWWKVFGLGEIGFLEGLIFPDFEQVDSLLDGLIETGGMDFGFTNDPSTFIHTKIDTARKAVYFDEVYYRKGMLNADMAAAMKDEGIPLRAFPIFADCAEPKTIAELCGYGYNVRPCYKATRKAEQLQAMRGWHIYVTKRSLNLIRELRGYVWQKDRDGNAVNEPIGINDHAIDAARYSFTTWLYEHQNKGRYSFR